VTVHQARTHLSRLMPLAPPPPRRIPGRLSSLGPLQNPDVLLEPMAAVELASWDDGHLPDSHGLPWWWFEPERLSDVNQVDR